MDRQDIIGGILLMLILLDLSGCDWLNCGHVVECKCKWSSGKKTASCAFAGLTKVPRLASDIQVLDLHRNSLKELYENAFSSIGLLNLQRLNLSSTSLHYIHEDAFEELKILIELDLSHNNLQQIVPNTFRGTDRLRILILNGNPLKQLHAEQFPLMRHMKKLEISHCQLQKIHPYALKNLQTLETIFAHQNLLSNVDSNTFNLPTLKTLTLSDNPWYCDCRLRDFHEWFNKANLGSELIFCSGPIKLSHVPWKSIRSFDMVCLPSVTVSQFIFRAEARTRVDFGCFANGDPKPTVWWSFHGGRIKNYTNNETKVKVLHYDIKQLNDYNNDIINRTTQWVNISIVNITDRFSGEWKCHANSSAGEASAYLHIILPKARTVSGTIPVTPEHSFFIFVIGSMLIMISIGFISTCICWKSRRRRLETSENFGDQEKKLLNSSLTSFDTKNIDLDSTYGFEMVDRSTSIDSGDSHCCNETVQITLEHTGIYPPPPMEFRLPAVYGNLFISLRLSGNVHEFPDLLSGEETLPCRNNAYTMRRKNQNSCPGSLAGCSLWSLPENNRSNASVENRIIPPAISTELTAL